MPVPGRSCPLDYRYGAAAIAAAPTFEAETLYVVGGLYGNLAALDEIERMAAAERGQVTIVFNGDFNWFNVGDASYVRINQRVLAHRATVGNVEAELCRNDSVAGCGCAYPDSVDQPTVERSNAIHARLRADRGASSCTDRAPGGPAPPCPLPCRRHARGHRPWRRRFACRLAFRHRRARPCPRQRRHCVRIFATPTVDVFACSHTCLPVMREVALAARTA